MKTLLATFFIFAGAFGLLAVDLASILAPLTAPGAPTSAQPEAKTVAVMQAQINEAEILAALVPALKSHLSLEGDLRLSVTQPWTPLEIPATAPWKVSILQTPSSGLSSTSLIRFRVDCGEKRVGEWQIVVRAQLLSAVWSAASRVSHRQPLSPALFQKVTLDLLRGKQAPVPAETDLTLYEASQPLNPSQILTWKDVSQLQAIRKGQAVEVVASEGAMNITMKGTAITGGAVGEDIIVRNHDSRRDISARVLDNSKARVKF